MSLVRNKKVKKEKKALVNRKGEPKKTRWQRKQELKQLVKKYKNVLAIFLIIVLVVSIGTIIYKANNSIVFVQLDTKSDEDTMGYLFKTKNNKIIVIDGGRAEDADVLEEYINDNGGKVDAWFITVPKKEHFGAFARIIESTDIKIDKVYYTINTFNWYNENLKGSHIEELKVIEDFYKIIQSSRIASSCEEVNFAQKYYIDNATIEILGIKNLEIVKNNPIENSSMIFSININNKKILFLSDSEEESIEKLNGLFKKSLKSDYVQIANHGKTEISPSFFRYVSARVALWPTKTDIYSIDVNSDNPINISKSALEENGTKEHIMIKDGLKEIKIK